MRLGEKGGTRIGSGGRCIGVGQVCWIVLLLKLSDRVVRDVLDGKRVFQFDLCSVERVARSLDRKKHMLTLKCSIGLEPWNDESQLGSCLLAPKQE